MRKISVTIVTFFILIIKPLYFFFFIFLFSFEYLFFCVYVYNILKKFKNYYVIEVKNIDLNNESVIDIWIELCRLQAFKRLYITLLRKGFSLKNLIICFIMILFGIPIRFLKLLLYFYKSPYNFRLSLERLYFENFYSVADWKIEILKKNIYLNPFNLSSFAFQLKESKSSNEKILKTFCALQEWYEECEKMGKAREKIVMLRHMQGFDKNDKKLWSAHFGLCEKGKTIHATSQIPSKIGYKEEITDFEDIQWWDTPMKSMITEKAKNPGSIISTNVAKIKWGDKHIYIPKKEVDFVKFSNLNTFHLDPDDLRYIEQRELEVKTILLSNLGEGYYNLKSIFIKNIVAGNFKTAFKYSSPHEFLKIIESKDEFENPHEI